MESKSQAAIEEPLISVSELAKRLGITPQIVYRMARKGALPHYRINSLLRFKWSEVLEARKQVA